MQGANVLTLCVIIEVGRWFIALYFIIEVKYFSSKPAIDPEEFLNNIFHFNFSSSNLMDKTFYLDRFKNIISLIFVVY